MLHEERILKHKFAYFFTIIFVLGWMIFFGALVMRILLKGYSIIEKYKGYEIPMYLLFFASFILLILTFISIFRESRKMFIYLNIAGVLIIALNLIIFYINNQGKTIIYTYSFLFHTGLLIVAPILLVNYFKYIPAKNEIEEIGKHKE